MNLLTKLMGRAPSETTDWIERGELSMMLNNPAPPLLIDVRGPDEFTGPLGHIDGASNIPLAQIPSHAVDLLGKHRPLVLICHTDRRSTAAADHLRRAGVSEVAVLRGGMVAWRSGPTP